jgi:hypothetical protein
LSSHINASKFVIQSPTRIPYYYVEQIILQAKRNGSITIGVLLMIFEYYYYWNKRLFIHIKKIVSLVYNNFVNGSAKITSFTLVYQNTFKVIEGNNSLYFPPKTAILSPTDYLFVESLDGSQIAAYESSISDYIWSNNTIKYIDRTTNYQLNIQIVIDDYIFTNSFAYNYSYDYSGDYTLSAQAGSLNQSQLVKVLTGYSLFLLFKE